MDTAQILADKSLVLIFAYAPVGLGHLRVTEALYRGLSAQSNPVLLRTQDKTMTGTYRLASVVPLGTKMMEWFQSGRQEEVFTRIYRSLLRRQTTLLYQQFATILDQRLDLPKTVLVVATHFGLAHQIAAIKKKLEDQNYVQIILIVQVTDDTSQHLWYIPGADLTFVPSEQTKKALSSYAKSQGSSNFNCEVLPYPISPRLSNPLSPYRFKEKLKQLNFNHKCDIHLAIPISGAAVGMDYSYRLINSLYQKSNRFYFHVICRSADYTQNFLAKLLHLQSVDLRVSPSTREIINKYELLYESNDIALEITKPSEQAFKALLTPLQVGGSGLLFTKPVGKQEYDNLAFLRRHNLVPSLPERNLLINLASTDRPLDGEALEKILKNAENWRGIDLPDGPDAAANFIWWLLKEDVLTTMASRFKERKSCDHLKDLGSDGVELFWKKTAQFIESST